MAAEAGLDWPAHWRALHAARVEQDTRLREREDDFWGNYAARFARGIDAPDPIRDLLLTMIAPGERVLDVGAGSGRYAIPFAARAGEVIAVEPSQGMAHALEHEAQQRGITTIRVLQSDWLTADAPQADVVICAHVVYFISEIEAFIQKLVQHARRLCAIAVRVDQRNLALSPLFEQVWGEPEQPEPSFIELYNLLYGMGIVAEVAIRRGGGGPGSFASWEEAETSAFRSIGPRDEATRERVRAYLRRRMLPQPNGGFTFPEGSPRVALISWRTG